MRKLELRADRAGPLVEVLARLLPDHSAAALIAAGAVFVEGKRAKDARATLALGARLVVHVGEAAPELAPLVRLFEDERIVVLDKAPGDHLNETETAARPALVERLGGAFVVHRLDRETSGAVVLAKSAAVAEQLSAAFRERRVEKVYVAIAEGRVPDGPVDAPIGPDKRRPRARRVRPDGQAALTELRTLAHDEGLSAVEARPHTGRTHQIRVHLAHLGAPILGDRLYGGLAVVRRRGAVVEVGRVLLHARRLVLPGWPPFEAPLPADLRALGLAIPDV